MKKVLALILALVLALGLVACGGTGAGNNGGAVNTDIPEEDRYGGTLDMYVGSFSDTFDPMYTTGWVSYNWSCGVYENPIARDEKGNFVPGVCNFELSEDYLTLKLWPREGVKFHNGNLVTIDDVVASIERAGGMVSNMKKFWTPYVESVTVEDGVATYTFTEFNINTLLYLAHWANWNGVMPKEILEKYGEDPVNQVEDAIGTGPYKVVGYQTNALIELVRFEDYIPTGVECENYAQSKKAYLDRVNVWVNGEASSVFSKLMAGEYDIGSVSADNKALLMDRGLLELVNPQLSMIAMSFNTKNPDRPTADPNLRKAIAAALDYNAIAETWNDEPYTIDARPMQAPYDTEIFNTADYIGSSNLELAKEYLAKSNYNGETIVLIDTSEGTPNVWQSNLEALGLNVEVQYMENTAYRAYRLENSNPYDCVFYSYEVKDNVPCQLSSTPRTAFWGSELKDKLFDDLTKVPAATEESIAIWEELAQHWIDDCSIVNFATFSSSKVHNPELVPNWPGLEYWYNAYWLNPEAHQ